MPALIYMQDGSNAIMEKLEEVNLNDDSSLQKMVSTSIYLTVEENKKLVNLLKQFKDFFAWSYEEMFGLNPSLICHTLNIQPGTKLVVQ